MFNFAAGPVSSMNFVPKRGFNMEVFPRDCLYIDYFGYFGISRPHLGSSGSSSRRRLIW